MSRLIFHISMLFSDSSIEDEPPALVVADIEDAMFNNNHGLIPYSRAKLYQKLCFIIIFFAYYPMQ